MTPQQVFESQTVRIVVLAVLIGIAWGELRLSVSQKADRVEVRELLGALSDSTKNADRTQLQLIAGMAADIRTVKDILCQRATADSFCHNK